MTAGRCPRARTVLAPWALDHHPRPSLPAWERTRAAPARELEAEEQERLHAGVEGTARAEVAFSESLPVSELAHGGGRGRRHQRRVRRRR